MSARKLPQIHSKYDDAITWNTHEPEPCLELNEIHIWSIKVSEHFQELFRRYRFLLSEDEFYRIKNYHRAQDVRKFLTSRIMVRLLAGRYLSIPPTAIPFLLRKGKPSLPGTPLKFNLSYANETVLISFGLCETGIDIEEIKYDFNFEEILAACFSQDERNDIDSGYPLKREKFFQQWTRKEAILKYTGQGIIDDLTLVPSEDGHHQHLSHKLKIESDINLLSFDLRNSNCVGSLAYPTNVTSIAFIEWHNY